MELKQLTVLIEATSVDKSLFTLITNFILIELKVKRFIFCHIVTQVLCYLDIFRYGTCIKTTCILDTKRHLFYHTEFYVLSFNGECKPSKNWRKTH